jgi:hypothetical protein
MGRLRQRLEQIYHPKVAPWKRPVLFGLSILGAVACLAAAWAQVQHHFTNDGVWLVIGLFGVLSVAGIITAIFGDDWWVALMLGGI